jgi:hypothetical protein
VIDARFQLLVKAVEGLLESDWLEAHVCKTCGTVALRVVDLQKFAIVANHPDSGVESVEGRVPQGPYR